VSIQKREILVKVKSKIPDFERGKAKIVTIPLFSGTGIHTLEYFEDYNLKRDAACPAIALATAEDRQKGPFMDGH
jgi:hypothetical protein